MDIELAAILQMLPHRPPFLFIDRVKAVIPLQSGTGIKYVTADEEIMCGYQPERMAFPGSLSLEMLAQTAAVICAAATMEKPVAAGTNPGSGYLVGANLHCEKPIAPGEMLEARVVIIKAWGRFFMADGEVVAGGNTIAKGNFTIAAA